MNRSRAPRSLTNTDLVLSYFSLARDHPFEDRVAAAAAAGYSGIGLYIGEYDRLKREGLSEGWLDEVLDKYDMAVAEIEVVSGWAQSGAARERNDQMEASAWEMADRWECRYLQAIGPYEGSVSDAAHAFAGLCDRAAEHGLVVGLEFLPFTNIFSAVDAMRIVDGANRTNGGLCVDIWHHTRGANDIEMLRALPGDRVMGIQMSDGPLVPRLPDYKDDCLRDRVAPGDGEFAVGEFIGTLMDIGVGVPWSLEVCNEQVWGQPGAEHARRCADAMRSFLL